MWSCCCFWRYLEVRRCISCISLRDQQRSTYTTCVEVAGRTLMRLSKPGIGSAAT
eukprot:COSAG02_NODE_52785_length_305_cov_4.529126_1_plen_54_part_01